MRCFKDKDSQKFWNIEIDKCSFTTETGEVGTEGQKHMKFFANETTCMKKYDKAIETKIKEGYVELSET